MIARVKQRPVTVAFPYLGSIGESLEALGSSARAARPALSLSKGWSDERGLGIHGSVPRHLPSPHVESCAMPDPFALQRFVDAQAPLYAQALAEIRAGRKRSHWSWFIFPQIRGLGSSPTSVRYAISGLDEARAYLAHPLLGERLRECVAAMMALPTRDAAEVLGDIDARKFCSCLTLFAAATGPGSPFEAALQHYFDGNCDPLTLARLGPQTGGDAPR
jgi:uncharacterized protein (DUF1810 family)